MGIASREIHIGPSDHVGWLDDRKWAYVQYHDDVVRQMVEEFAAGVCA
jgi:myo-inositol-1-phosphate synthase